MTSTDTGANAEAIAGTRTVMHPGKEAPARARWSSAALAMLLTSCAALPPMPPPPPAHPASPEAEEAPPPPASTALAPRPSDDKKPASPEHGSDMGGMR